MTHYEGGNEERRLELALRTIVARMDAEDERNRCDGRYAVPQTSPPRDEPFDVTYRCGQLKGHDGPHRF